MKTLNFKPMRGINFIIKTAWSPLLLLIMGLFFKNLFWIPTIKANWNEFLGFADGFGSLLMALSVTLFIYLISLSACKVYKQYLTRNEVSVAPSIISIIKKGLTAVFSLIVINQFISVFKLKSDYVTLAHNFIIIIIIATVSWVLLEALAIIETLVYGKLTSTKIGKKTRKTAALYTKIHILRYIAQSVILFLAVAASLMVFDTVRNIGISLLASAGFLTAVLALAAQKSLGSLFVGVQLLLSHPLEIGDFVVVEKESGIVEEITLTYVIIRTWDSRRIIFPINYFIEKPFQNWSRATSGILGEVKFYVDYRIRMDSIREELHRFLQENPLWDKRAFEVLVADFKENKVELQIVLSAMNPTNLNKLRNQLREKLVRYLCENDIG